MELTVDDTLEQVAVALNQGKVQHGEYLLRSIIQSEPKHPVANHSLGLLAVSTNRISTALPFFKVALESNNNIEQFWLSYIDALIKAKKFDDAKQLLRKAKEKGIEEKKLESLNTHLETNLKPKIINIRNPSQEQLSCLLKYYQAGNIAEAEKLAIYLTNTFPSHQFGWKVLGSIFKYTGKINKALEATQKSVQLQPNDNEAHFNLGNIYREIGRFNEAEASYKKSIFLKRNYAECYFNLAITLTHLGKFDESEKMYREVIKLKPASFGAHANLGDLLLKRGQFDEGIKEKIVGDGIVSFDLKNGLTI